MNPRLELTLVLALLAGCALSDAARIRLMPVEGRMMVNAVVPHLDRQVFGLGIPETIGGAEEMWLLNHPDAEVRWQLIEGDGRATTRVDAGRIRYDLELIPAEDHVDLVMTIRNRGAATWHDVFAFNCVSPAKAANFRDSTLTRTYVSVDGRPVAVADLPRIPGPRPGVTVYPIRGHEQLPPFAESFQASTSVRSDGSWVAVISEAGDAHMATVAGDAAFLFTNTSFGCIHAAPSFGDIPPGGEATVRARAWFSKGGLGEFLERYEAYRKAREPGG